MPRILQLTDLHLFQDPAARLKGVPTWETFREVCRHVKEHAGDWDLLVITGDMAHDELSETYRLLREELGDWLPCCRLLPGNHDNPAALRDNFPEVLSGTGEFLAFAQAVGNWWMLGLDSQWPGEVPGRIEAEQYAWLREKLKHYQEHPVLLFLHHPPVSVESAWLDEIGLKDPEPFHELIRQSPQVRVIATGHVHHVFQGKLGSADVLTTPSTAMQFNPSGSEPSYTHDPPGYRVFDLGESEYRTQVFRLPVLQYPPQSP